MRIPQYVEFVQRGDYRFGVDLEVVRETPALVVCDGHWGLGQVQAHRLLDLVIPKARALGVAVGTARDCGHIGRLGEYAERAAGLGLLLLATVNNGGAVQRVAPPGGIEPRLSTNPFCAGVPTSDPEAPIVVDFGTSIVAEGKVRGYYISKQSRARGLAPGSPRSADDRSRRPLRAAAGDDPPAGRHAILQGLRPGPDPGPLGRGASPAAIAVKRPVGASPATMSSSWSWIHARFAPDDHLHETGI